MCEFGEETDSLIRNAVKEAMNNKNFQEQKNDPQVALRFAVAYEEGINQHRTHEGKGSERERKQEPVFVVNERRNYCTRCGQDFTQSQFTFRGRCRNNSAAMRHVSQKQAMRRKLTLWYFI